MGVRVSVSITIGGSLADALIDDFVHVVQADSLSIEWDGEDFGSDQFPDDGPLRLYAHDVRNGEIANVEDFCCAQNLPFVRWSGGAPGAFGPEIVVWTGSGERIRFAADEEEHVVIDAVKADELGSFEAIAQHFADGCYQPPAFRIAE